MGNPLETTHLTATMMLRPLSPEQAALQQRLFREAVEPIQQMKLHIYSLYLPTLILDSEGRFISAAYPDEVQELVTKLNKVIEEMATQWLVP